VMLGFGPGLKSRNEDRGEEMEAGRLEGSHRGTSGYWSKELVMGVAELRSVGAALRLRLG
jgi:hypothetical protein